MKHVDRHLAALLLGALFLAGNSLHATPADLTPQSHEYLIDQVKYRGIKFVHGKQIIIYAPPPGWSCSGDAKATALQPPNGTSSARAEISHQEGVPTPSWDTDGQDVLMKRAQALLPPLAKNVELFDMMKNPLRIDGHETIRFVFTGQLFASNYKFFVVLLPMENEQFSFVMYAETKDYEVAAMPFMQSLYSFHWEKPTP